MSWEIIFTFIVLGASVILFVTDKVRLDLVAIGVMLALGLSGILTPAETVAGFGSTVVILIAGLFVVGEGLAQTGISYAVGDKIVQVAGHDEWKLIVLLMLSVAALASVMSVTGSGAIFIPVAIRLATRAGISPSKLLMPLAYGALIGGMLTLIGTPPNLVVSAQLQEAGLEPFNFFAFSPIGLIILAIAVVYMVFYGRKMLRDDGSAVHKRQERRSLNDMISAYGVKDQIVRLELHKNSILIDETVVSVKLRRKIGLTVFGIEDRDQSGSKPKVSFMHSEIVFQEGDVIYGVMAEPLSPEDLAAVGMKVIDMDEAGHHLSARELGIADLIVTQRSRLVGRKISGAGFRTKHNLTIVGIMRRGKAIRGNIGNIEMEFGDQLLVLGEWRDIQKLRASREDFLLLSFPEEINNYLPRRKLAPIAIGILLVMLCLIIFRVVPSVLAVVLAAAAMVVTQCVDPKKAYTLINWRSLVLIAGMIPMATALDKTGGLALIVDKMLALNGANSPYMMLISFFLLTSVLSQFTSNTATAVLLAPVAFEVAKIMGVNPEPLLMSVAIAASTAFSTPVASPINTLVMGPGNYRFRDFAIIGVPLQVIALIISTFAIPIFLPF
ncbi:TrkA-C domain-containing protein [Cohaesibacter sp. ES.047]|uniref:SLC13 family permease n=1 Tax=Cohaesibacter sp. ES.047 TaxID=1798205 RepID=UPI000BB81F1E|nr:SLC13 family permease [Cohaesibacter sp. ES.047]SNY94198.1 TrkA-C domain-containing protein [Cohaesibacter sp. ES.047]